MVDRHETILRNMTRQIAALDPVCSVVAVGSVGRGEHRQDSDIDLMVVTWIYKKIADKLDWEHAKAIFCYEGRIEARLDQGSINGIGVDLHCRTPRNHHQVIMCRPVYRWGKVRILYDPSGIAKWGEECIQQFLSDNSDIARKIQRFHEQHQKWKRDRTFRREFEDQMEFAHSLDLSKAIFSYESFSDKELKRPIC